MKKAKFLAAAAGLFLLAGVFTGCGSDAEESAEGKELHRAADGGWREVWAQPLRGERPWTGVSGSGA